MIIRSSLNFRWLLQVIFTPSVTSELTCHWCHPVTSQPKKQVVILTGWLSKHSHNYNYETFWRDCHLIFSRLRGVEKFQQSLSQTAKLHLSSRLWIDKLNYEWTIIAESTEVFHLEPLCNSAVILFMRSFLRFNLLVISKVQVWRYC